MPRVEGTRNRIDEQEGNAETEQITALDRLPVTTAVLVALQLNERMERFFERTRVARRDAECIAAVHEDARLGPHEIGGWRVSRDEVIVESDTEGVEAFSSARIWPIPAPPTPVWS
jgi:hypothetical protein